MKLQTDSRNLKLQIDDACRKAIAAGKICCEEMPHEETMWMMRQLDQIRNICKIHYDFE